MLEDWVVIKMQLQGFSKLLENPLSHPLLRVLLPNLQSGFHDPSEKVKIAFCDLLLMVKKLKSIKVSRRL